MKKLNIKGLKEGKVGRYVWLIEWSWSNWSDLLKINK